MNDLTPQSMRSPVSPYGQQSKPAFSIQQTYPASPQPEASPMAPSTHGLGIYDCALPPQQSPAHDLPPSPQSSDNWSHSSMMEQEYHQTSQQAPDISTAAYDVFSGFYNNGQSQMMPASSPEAPGLVYCQTPPSTNMPSHRNSVSSAYSPSESYDEQQYYATPKVKMENGEEWYQAPGNEHVLQRSLTTQGLSPYSNGVSPINGPTDDSYMSKQASGSYQVDFSNSIANDESRPRFDSGAPTLPSVNRIKKKRQRTTPEEATHECRVCGKLFKRSYNWKSHMETHNPERKYPHPCTAMVGNQPCPKKFQRKTDLDRHRDSVHLKARNHRCPLCGNRFARRDTLRRHTEDGCPKRFELGFRENSAATPAARWSLNTLPQPGPPQQRSFSIGGAIPIQRPTSIMAPPMSAGPHQHPFGGYERPSFVSSPVQAPSVFAS